MADPHVILAPIVEPPLPPVPASPAAPVALLPLVLVSAALLLAALPAGWWWRRQAAGRALRRIARTVDPLQAAQQLARWQQRYWPQAPAQWRQALDRLRFGPPDAAAAATLQALCAEAGQAGRGR